MRPPRPPPQKNPHEPGEEARPGFPGGGWDILPPAPPASPVAQALIAVRALIFIFCNCLNYEMYKKVPGLINNSPLSQYLHHRLLKSKSKKTYNGSPSFILLLSQGNQDLKLVWILSNHVFIFQLHIHSSVSNIYFCFVYIKASACVFMVLYK